jgi:hypothetical protein
MSEGDERLPRGPKGDKGDRGEGMTRHTRQAMVFLFALSFLLAAGALLFTSREIGLNNQKWCTTLELLTSRPVPRPPDPAANPSREQAYVLYTDFRDLRHRLGCR